MSRTVVVTGGCGYIGSHIARAFKNVGDSVFIIDRIKREHTLKNIDGWFISDFADDDALATIVDLNPDIIVHCAGTSLVGPSMEDPGEYYDNNISKTVKLLNLIRDLRKKPLIMFSSSASVYGEPTAIPIHESAEISPISPYGNTKAMTEIMLKDYWYAHAMPSVCFRYFNVAGAEPYNFDLGQEPEATHIVARVLEASIAGRGFTINGDNFPTDDGTCIRDYVHVWDIAQAHVNAADYVLGTQPLPRTGAYVFNLGNNNGISNKQIVKYVANKYGLPFVNYSQMRSGDPARLLANSDKARDTLQWHPKHSTLEEIIDSAYKWYTR